MTYSFARQHDVEVNASKSSVASASGVRQRLLASIQLPCERLPERLISSRATQLGKEDMFLGCHHSVQGAEKQEKL